MPYSYYGKMDPEDIYSIISYIRSLPPVESEIPDSKADFPVNMLLRTMPVNATPTMRPDPSDQVAYGAYIMNASGCAECHTQVDPRGTIIKDQLYAGGRDFPFPNGSKVNSSNLTQDKETGIGSWTEEMFVTRFKQYADSGYVEEMFVTRFKQYADSGYQAPRVQPGEFNSIMPWTMYAGMKEEDLKAIYAYLKTVKPIPNKVVKFIPARASE